MKTLIKTIYFVSHFFCILLSPIFLQILPFNFRILDKYLIGHQFTTLQPKLVVQSTVKGQRCLPQNL